MARFNRVALVTLFAGGFGIGFAPILVRLCKDEVGPSTIAFYRVLFALPVLWIMLQREKRQTGAQPQPETAGDFLALSLAGILFVLDLGIWHWAITMTSVANATLLANLAPIFVTVGAAILLKERITGLFVLSLLLAIVGATLLVQAHLGESLKGEILAVVAATFYGAYLLLLKQLRKRFSGITIVAWAGLTACPGFLLMGAILNESFWPQTWQVWVYLSVGGIICHVGGQTLIAKALGQLPASFSSVGLLIQPVMATALAWYLFDEHLGSTQILGGVLVLFGIALASQQHAKQQSGLPPSSRKDTLPS